MGEGIAQTCRRSISTWSDTQQQQPAAKCKPKPQWATASHLLAWSNLRQIKTSVYTDMEKLEPHTLLMGLWNGVAYLENYLAVFQKVTLWSRNSTLRYVPKRIENMCLYKTLYMNVHSSIIQIAKRWKQPKCPPNEEWVNKRWYVHTMEYYLSLKKEWTTGIC